MYEPIKGAWAELLTNCTTPTCLCHLGNEEFGTLLTGCSHHRGLDVANRIKVTIDTTPVGHDDYEIKIQEGDCRNKLRRYRALILGTA